MNISTKHLKEENQIIPKLILLNLTQPEARIIGLTISTGWKVLQKQKLDEIVRNT